MLLGQWLTWRLSELSCLLYSTQCRLELTSLRILTKRGYSCQIDWWSLGVCAYELIFGRRPFRGRTNNDLTYSITKDPLKWPEDAESKCSRPGMQVLKGVNFYIYLALQVSLSASYWTATLRDVLAVNHTVKVIKNSGGTHGSRILTGTPWNRKNRHLRLFLTYVCALRS